MTKIKNHFIKVNGNYYNTSCIERLEKQGKDVWIFLGQHDDNMNNIVVVKSTTTDKIMNLITDTKTPEEQVKEKEKEDKKAKEAEERKKRLDFLNSLK